MKVYKEMASPELGVESSMIFPSAVMLAHATSLLRKPPGCKLQDSLLVSGAPCENTIPNNLDHGLSHSVPLTASHCLSLKAQASMASNLFLAAWLPDM